MNRTTRRVFSVLLCLILALSLIPAAAASGEAEESPVPDPAQEEPAAAPSEEASEQPQTEESSADEPDDAPALDGVSQIAAVTINNLTTPKAGSTVSPFVSTERLSVPSGAGYSIESSTVLWRDEMGTEITSDYRLEAGRTYYVELSLSVKDRQYEFAVNPIVSLPHATAGTYTVSAERSIYSLRLRIFFTLPGTCAYTPIDTLKFSGILNPRDGSTAQETLGGCTLAYNNASMSLAFWQDDDHNIVNVVSGGRHYLYLRALAFPGYEFASPESMDIYINGKNIRTLSDDIRIFCNHDSFKDTYNGQYVQRLIMEVYIGYDIPAITVTKVDRIYVDLPMPYAGEAAMRISTPKSIHVSDEYPYAPQSNWYCWYDADWNLLDENDRFAAGETYILTIPFLIEDTLHYRFADSVEPYINGADLGEYETYIIASSASSVTVQFHITAKARPKTIDSVSVSITPPAVGASPSYSPAVSGAELYGTDPIIWYDTSVTSSGSWKTMSASDRFQSGHTYRASIWLSAAAGHEFAAGWINGSYQPKVTAASNAGTASVSKAYEQNPDEVIVVSIDFDAPAGAASSLSGTVTSLGSASDMVLIQLIPSGGAEAAYETIVYGNSAPYSIPGVADGSYTLTAMKNGHVAGRQTVYISGAVTQNVALRLYGDVNGDGSINRLDAALILRYAAERLGSLTYPDAADMDQDGRITALDAARILR